MHGDIHGGDERARISNIIGSDVQHAWQVCNVGDDWFSYETYCTYLV